MEPTLKHPGIILDAVKELEALQELVNELAKTNQYGQYVKQHKLGLIDSRMSRLDVLMEEGLLKTPC
jgi:ribosome assembly protein YihI (activator of Der GTPase)